MSQFVLIYGLRLTRKYLNSRVIIYRVYWKISETQEFLFMSRIPERGLEATFRAFWRSEPNI